MISRATLTAFLVAVARIAVVFAAALWGAEPLQVRVKADVVTREAPPVLLQQPGPADAFWPGDASLKWDVHPPITGLILAGKLKELGVPLPNTSA